MMYEIICPNCEKTIQKVQGVKIYTCPDCSTSFYIGENEGTIILNQHTILPNVIDTLAVRELVLEWLRRTGHDPKHIDNRYIVTDISGVMMPYWVISVAAYTLWKGLVKREHVEYNKGSTYLTERGEFIRQYKWAISARANICEYESLVQLHHPVEPIQVQWDGFPVESTLSSGILKGEEDTSIDNTQPVKFEYKFANGLPVLSIQVDDNEAIRRASHNIELYHHKLAQLNVDYLIDYDTKIEISDIELCHIPLWEAKYVLKPRFPLGYLMSPDFKTVVIDGNNSSIVTAELPMKRQDKLKINAAVTGISAVLLILMAYFFHPSIFLASLFMLGICGYCLYKFNIDNRHNIENRSDNAAIRQLKFNDAYSGVASQQMKR